MIDRFAVVAALADGSRRALYEYVRRQGRGVGREQAAEATGMSRGLAAFHLDKLVDAGLLTARHEAPPDQPRGRGRAPKLYEPTAADGLTITVPERRYELMAEILADGVAGDPHAADGAAMDAAYRRGREIGADLRVDGEVAIPDALTRLGFEPAAEGRTVRLHNCPFHALAQRHTALICGLNQRFVTGLLDGLAAEGVEALLAPRPGQCCVELHDPSPRPRSR